MQGYSQTVPVTVNFKTPEVNAFNKFVETPVSQYTGVPNISIPLYEINIKGVNVPITLDYHAGGIRVDQDATWVGLGWNLNYGGEISRKVRGIPDERHFILGGTTPFFSVNYFMGLPDIGPKPDPAMNDARYDLIRSAKFGGSDFMPDEFYYSTLGYSGRFMFSQKDNKYLLFPKEDINITNYPIVDRQLKSWNLKLPNGTSVDFGRDAYTTHDGTISNVPATILDSWQVKAIKNCYNDSITYIYEKSDYRQTKINGQNFRVSTRFPLTGSTSLQDIHLVDSKVKTINFPTGRIEFVTQLRDDMPGKALNEIRVYNLNNVLVRTVKFNYGYFYGNAYEILSKVNPIASNSISDDYKNKRLKLESISIINGVEQPLKYAFDYYISNNMPSKYSFSQDHWGYYNGIPNNTLYGFIPNLDARFEGGDRSVKGENSKVFSLKSIVYPEGGKREFVYETNTAGTWHTPLDLLMTYQDDNIDEQTVGINVSSYSRNTNYPAADEVQDRTRFFRKRFTVPGGAYPVIGNGWKVSTNFGISEKEKSTPYFADNVEFKLEAINPDGSRRIVKTFNTTSTGYPSDGTQRNGIDTAYLRMGPGEYEMTVKMLYLNQANTPADDQPYNLYFAVKWRQLNLTADMVNVGGLRIKDINYYDVNETLVKRKSYKYINSHANSKNPNFTSGRIISFPQYMQEKVQIHDKEWILDFQSNSVLPLETTSGSFAGYEYVDEYDVDFAKPQGDLRTSYHFSFVEPYFGKEYLLKNTGLWESKEWSRGKLLNKQYYKNNSLIKSEDFDYYYWSPHLTNDTKEDYVEEINTDFISWQNLEMENGSAGGVTYQSDFFDTIMGIHDNCVCFFYGSFHNHVEYNKGLPVYQGEINVGSSSLTCDYYTTVPYFKHNTAFDKLKSKTTTTYDDNTENPVVQTENYNYERTPIHYQLTKTESASSSSGSLSAVNLYPQDLSLNGSAESGRLKLISNHQLATVLSQANTKNSSTITTKTDYKVDAATNLVVPDVVKSTNIITGEDEIKNVYLKFDSKGNVLSLKQPGGMTVNYIWAYNGQFPVAEIKNADYTTVENLITKVAIDNFSKSSPDKTQVDVFLAVLRTNLTSAQITSYVYDPLAGMTSSTDAKGQTSYFDYDALQRLKFIRDQNRNIVKSYNYNYLIRYRNKEISKVFTRNNCGVNEAAGNVTYRVPEGTFIEWSQLEADNKALNELNTKGQEYANQNAGCTICSGPDKKILNGNCETGNKVYTKSIKDTPNGSTYTCTYHYQWSDGSKSVDYTEKRNGPCMPPQS